MDWRRVPSLSSLRALEAAVRHQSLTKAAAELSVTHAAIAQHVRTLEADFAQSLIVRQGRGVEGTAAGQRLASGLNDGFAAIATAVEDLRSVTENRPINVTTTPAFAANWLMPRIGDFWSKYPDISININPSLAAVNLREDGFDLAIRYGAGNWPGHEVKPLSGSEFWVVARPDLLEGRQTKCLEDVADLPWIIEEYMMELHTALESEGVDLNKVELRRFSSNSLAKSGVLAGLGVSVQHKSLVEDDVESGLIEKICELSQDGLGYYTVVVPGRSPKGLETFVKWLHAKTVKPT